MLNTIFAFLVFSFFVSLILIYFISKHDQKIKNLQKKANITDTNHLDHNLEQEFREFTKFCVDLCEYLKLEVQDLSQSGKNEVSILALSSNPITQVQYLIVGFHLNENEVLDNNKVMEISDQIVSERISKGIIITTGSINSASKNLPELAPIEFIDGNKIKELKTKIIL